MVIMIFLTELYTEEANITTTREPPIQKDDTKYLIVPVVVIVLVMLLSLLVYCMAKRRKMNKLRRDIARLYELDERELEWDPLNSYEHPYYNSGDSTNLLTKSDNYMPTTNL